MPEVPTYQAGMEKNLGRAGPDTAVTKAHPIKSTLKVAINYISSPNKTDGKLVSSFGCTAKTADKIPLKQRSYILAVLGGFLVKRELLIFGL